MPEIYLSDVHFGDQFHQPSISGSVTCRWAEPLKQGDRVRIREGYAASGDIGLYGGMSATTPAMVMVHDLGGCKGECSRILAAAIEPYPLTREERIEAAIEDAEYALADIFPMASHTFFTLPETRALLHAILDAGV